MSDGTLACLDCHEPVLDAERQVVVTVVSEETWQARPAVRHYECAARTVVGSVGHQLGLCACDDGPGTLDDPTGVSKRDAARLALAVSNALCSYAEQGAETLAHARTALALTALELERRRAWNPTELLRGVL